MFEQAIEIIRQSAVVDGDKIRLTCGELDRKIYKQVDDLLKRFCGEWKGGKVSAHVFPFPITGSVVIDSILSGNIPPINPYDLFPTPESVLDSMMAELMSVFPNFDAQLTFLEPSGGTGAIARRLRDTYPNARIDIIEIDPINIRILQEQGFSPVQADFTTYIFTGQYDAVVMNPPFAGTTYIDHIQKAITLIASHGVVISVAPDSLRYQRAKAVKRLLAAIHERSWIIEALPKQSFKESGTNVDTVLLTIHGEAQDNAPTQGYASRKIANLRILADNDYDTYTEKDLVLKRFPSVSADSRGNITDRAFIQAVETLYTAYMDRNPFDCYAFLDAWEWSEIAKDLAHDYGLVSLPEPEPESEPVAIIPIPEPAPTKREAKAEKYAQLPMFS